MFKEQAKMDAQQVSGDQEQEEEEVIYRDLIDVVTCIGCGNETGWRYTNEWITIQNGDEVISVAGNYYHCQWCGYVHQG